MKFALIDGDKKEATKGAIGLCQFCSSSLIAKCGDIKVHHWAHKSQRNCDLWWENETEWHRAWKNNFPKEWQEIVHFDENGEKHIADVKAQNGWVLEFQHSYLNNQERLSRNNFYQKLVWVVDGTRRKTDKKQLQSKLNESRILSKNFPIILSAHFPNECRLIKEWQNNKSLVFFDFNEAENNYFWFLFPITPSGNAYLSRISRLDFIELFNNGNFDKFYKNTIVPIHTELVNLESKQQTAILHNRYNAVIGAGRQMNNRQIRKQQRRL